MSFEEEFIVAIAAADDSSRKRVKKKNAPTGCGCFSSLVIILLFLVSGIIFFLV